MMLTIVSVSSEEHYHTIEVGAGTEECFYTTVLAGQTMEVEYAVLSAGGQYAKLDINFRLVDPRGIPLVAEFKRRAGSHSHSNIVGDYKFCFDNKFSVTSPKVVYFEVTLERDDENYDDLARVFRDGEKFGVEDEYEGLECSDEDIADDEGKLGDICHAVTMTAIPPCMLEDAEARGMCLLDAAFDAIPFETEMTGHELMQLCHCKAFNKIRKTLSNVQKLTCAPLAAEGGEREGHNYQPSPYPAQYYPYSPYTLWFQYTLCKEEGLFCYLFTNNWSQNDFGQYYLFDNLVDAGEESEDGGLLALALLGQLGAKPAPFFPTSLINYRKRRSSGDDTDESCDPTKEVCPGNRRFHNHFNRRRRDAECDSDGEDCSGNRRRRATEKPCDPAVEYCPGNRRRRGAV